MRGSGGLWGEATHLDATASAISRLPGLVVNGRVGDVSGLAVEIAGMNPFACLGDAVELTARDGRVVAAEIVGFVGERARAMPFAAADGLGPSASAALALRNGHGKATALNVDEGWIGRVIDPLGRPLDGLGPLCKGRDLRPVRAAPPEATRRGRLGAPIDLGVGVLNAFTPCREGQRIGLFAASGVGKSTLLGMLARYTACDVAVLALVGERGREVRDFIEDELGPEGLARSVVIVATSDATPLIRRQAAHAAMTVAEHFRDSGRSVLLLMDSITRFCLALREIGLAAGEPPATRGYPPSVFAELPRLLERAGPGVPDAEGRTGRITAFFTVLVEGGDHDEPVADAVRGILDGHVVLDRAIAEGGRYPAVDIARSLSRAAAGCLEPEQAAIARRARGVLARYAEVVDLVRLGAFRRGTDPAVDEAVALAPRIEAALRQDPRNRMNVADSISSLASAMELAS